MVMTAIAVSPSSAQSQSQSYCRSLGAKAGWELGYTGQPQQWTCYIDIPTPTPIQQQQAQIITSVAAADFIHDESALEREQTYTEVYGTIPTSQTTPLISQGVADKLLEAGFEKGVVDPLTKTGWDNTTVERFMEESRSLGITPPRDISPTTLIITPTTTPQTTPQTTPNYLPILLVLGAVLLLKK